MELQEYLKTLVEMDASDLYLTVARPPMYRVNGTIQAVGEQCFTPEDLESLATDMLNERQINEFAQTNEMNLATALPGTGATTTPFTPNAS